jgi:hypothetical protein
MKRMVLAIILLFLLGGCYYGEDCMCQGDWGNGYGSESCYNGYRVEFVDFSVGVCDADYFDGYSCFNVIGGCPYGGFYYDSY